MIHCIGDSHSAVFSGEEKMQPEWPIIASNKLPYFKSYRVGPATAYQLENKKQIIDDILSKNYNDGDSLLFCFGEVDIRAHLLKQMDTQKRCLDDIVKECVEEYRQANKSSKIAECFTCSESNCYYLRPDVFEKLSELLELFLSNTVNLNPSFFVAYFI